MIPHMKWLFHHLPALVCGLVFILLPHRAFALDDALRDARREGYSGGGIDLASDSGVALTWLIFALLAVVCVGVTFKNANRSHLD